MARGVATENPVETMIGFFTGDKWPAVIGFMLAKPPHFIFYGRRPREGNEMRVTPTDPCALLCRCILALSLCASTMPASAQQTEPSTPPAPPAFNNIPPITAAPPPPATSSRPPPPASVAPPAPAATQPAPPPAAPKETATQPSATPPASAPKSAPTNAPATTPKSAVTNAPKDAAKNAPKPASKPAPKTPPRKPAMSAREEYTLLMNPCRNELLRYCRTVRFGNGRTVACLKRHEAALGRACSAAVARAAARL